MIDAQLFMNTLVYFGIGIFSYLLYKAIVPEKNTFDKGWE